MNSSTNPPTQSLGQPSPLYGLPSLTFVQSFKVFLQLWVKKVHHRYRKHSMWTTLTFKIRVVAVHVCATCSKIQYPCTFATECTYVSHIIVGLNNDYYPNSINRLMMVLETQYVSCYAATELLTVAYTNFKLKKLSYIPTPRRYPKLEGSLISIWQNRGSRLGLGSDFSVGGPCYRGRDRPPSHRVHRTHNLFIDSAEIVYILVYK
jgi:hypothetical protein